MKVNKYPQLTEYISEKLHAYWTPEEIAGRWNSENHLDKNGNKIIISYNAIYKYLYSPYGQKLCHLLPSKRYKKKKRKKKKSKKTNKHRIPNRISISQPIPMSSDRP